MSTGETTGTTSGTSVDTTILEPRIIEVLSSARSRSPQEGEEQALESHEVIELQTFSERKAWIEEKIKLLGKMPPIEVFAGMDAIRSSANEVPGLPTRAELQQWIVEHDRIEKETEIFDSGELRKLKKFTKAATQRNLSPEDTDLIELTLTTIYELDKLLHLLRDRSEHLDLLGTRLTWEEHRTAAWSDRSKIFADLQAFLTTRARWSPSYLYEALPKTEGPMTRRGSVASMASMASDTSISSPGFSRSARFKLAELLSRDAAQFGARISSLRHSKISAAGKTLDKLIDNSRRPVPEEILDEQDRLEEKGINELEKIGKFVMSLVMQWRKADEIYVETMKDQSAAHNLLEEIETAKLHHPTSRQSTSFVSRADALVKRLSLRGDPALRNSTFPRPLHPLFPDQQASNESLANSLSSDIAAATTVSKTVDALAKDYRVTFEAVKHVETLTQAANDLSAQFSVLTERLCNGIPTNDGDGTPPDLSSQLCLEPMQHAAFLALLPSVLDDLDKSVESADVVLRDAQSALLALDRPGIDLTFRTNAASLIETLSEKRTQAQKVRGDVVSRVNCLRDARKIWLIMGDSLKEVEDIRRDIGDVMEMQRWKQQTGRGATPLTPESPSINVPSIMTSNEAVQRLNVLHDELAKDTNIALSQLPLPVDSPLRRWFSRSSAELASLIENVNKMARLLEAIRNQATAMESIREEVHDLQIRVEDLKLRFESSIDDVLGGESSSDDFGKVEMELSTEAAELDRTVQTFSDGLSQRVLFVAQRDSASVASTHFVKRRFSSVDLKFGASQQLTSVELPFELATLDEAVRNDSNSYAMLLSGELQSLNQKSDHLRLARMAKDIDTSLGRIIGSIYHANQELSSFRSSLSVAREQEDKLDTIQALSNQVDGFSQASRMEIARSFSPIRELLRRMASIPSSSDSTIYETVLLARTRSVDDVEIKFNAWTEEVSSFKVQISDARRTEVERLEQIRVEQERARKEERLTKEKLELERLEKQRLEKERLSKEKLEQERLEQERLEKERLEQEQERLEKERLERDRLKRERLEKERSERERSERERLEKLEQERLETERLEREKREQERLEAERLEQQRLEAEKFEAERLEKERQEQDRERAELAKARSEADVFGLRIAPSSPTKAPTREASELQAKILSLRRRLRSISINEVARPSSSSGSLPTQDQRKRMEIEFVKLGADVAELPSSLDDPMVGVELQSLRSEMEASAELMQRIGWLANLRDLIHLCDMALSDLLEHIDSYPSAPAGPLLSSHVTQQPSLSSEEQLSSRMSFTKTAVNQMNSHFVAVSEDLRAISERKRILQTWSELEDMGNDRVVGKKSRPASVISSGRNSSVSVSDSSSMNRKKGAYSNLSVGSSSRGRHLTPAHPSARRVVSGSSDVPSRTSSRLSTTSTTRSVSGPVFKPFSHSSSLFSSTFASRQRTTSLSSNSNNSPAPIPARRIPAVTSRPRAQTGQANRTSSPALSDTSSLSRSTMSPSRMSLRSTWGRAPRQSFSTLPRFSTPPKRPSILKKKTYVADPKNKLDVAVGDVVNQLPVNINVEVVADTWKDQSGKYWIGDQEPKLCFCRILRSETVMVRVGGGWTELSRFIKDHFADLFRLIPESPPRPGAREEKWISSATLLEAPETALTPPRPPATPEPKGPFVPSFILSTPSGQSTRSMKSTPSAGGSPLTPLQFIRRAEDAPGMRPKTPSKTPTSLRPRSTVPSTPSRNSIWRP